MVFSWRQGNPRNDVDSTTRRDGQSNWRQGNSRNNFGTTSRGRDSNWRDQRGEPSGVFGTWRSRLGRERDSNATSDQRRNNFNERPSERRNFRSSTESLHRGETSALRFIGFAPRTLETLLEKDPEELLMELSDEKKGFAEFVKEKLTDAEMVIFVKLLKKACESLFSDLKHKVLQIYLDDKIIDKLIKFLVVLSVQSNDDKEKNEQFWNDPEDFWSNLINVCQYIYDTLPTFARKILPVILKSLLNCFESFEQHISDEIKDNVTRLSNDVQKLIKQYEDKGTKSSRKNYEGEPPDDFRLISVYPNSYELLNDKRGFLRRNVVDGPYKDVNHYLDVQFRLLREDFVGPLRSAICSFRSDEKNRLENVRVHKKVRFLNQEAVNEMYCHRLCFNFSKKRESFRYENSKRFIFGSLLCFSADNFQSIFFGKVVKGDVVDLEKGELVVGFEDYTVVNNNIDYLMIECGIYFEPYYHVLNVLQKMDVHNFPMEKYIIHVDTDVQPPKYLQLWEEDEKEDFFPSFLPRSGLEFDNFYEFKKSVTQDTVMHNLNESQSRAFESALTEELCVIQGPPGTGKTYLGLKIAKTLLEMEPLWHRHSPMLVVCYTNHALDQFLEGISEFTSRIVRVGGQSKNENMEIFNLRNQRSVEIQTIEALRGQKNFVKYLMRSIEEITVDLKYIERYDSVIDFAVFSKVEPGFHQTWFGTAARKDILEWLLSGAEDNEYEAAVQIQQESADLDESAQCRNIDGRDENSNVEFQFDDIFEKFGFLITLNQLKVNIRYHQFIIANLQLTENPDHADVIKERESRFNLPKLEAQLTYLNFRLAQGRRRSGTITDPPVNTDLKNPHNMSHDERWQLYFFWLNLYKERLLRILDEENEIFRRQYRIYEEMRDVNDTRIMKEALVVGMTTTGAARLRSTLQALKSPIVIVEEAAEVLEAHIISSLTKHCEHLILIGDHQQLKPSTANYTVEKFYDLAISLFERMAINKIQLYTLNVQHRMRPEISSLIAPTIYPGLKNDPSVEGRPQIMGLDHCVYFIHHENKEDDCQGTSKKNYHEAEFLIYFATHLILNGYQPENITILAAYMGQMFEMQRIQKKHEKILEDVRIAVLDNYQGEECDIILLSLVRNNDENKIGFLSIENRVCVALSRARNGLYVMGNMNQLCAASELWQKIRHTFEQQNAIGTKLSLRCQIHSDTVTEVEKGSDFLSIPEGGCSRKCESVLECGHTCTLFCHILDKDHLNYKCKQLCSKLLCDKDPLHLCKKTCYQECGPCKYLVQKELPCGHVDNLECHEDPEKYECVKPIPTTLFCGHVANKPCHQDLNTFKCPLPCETKIESCGHSCILLCHADNDPDHLQYQCKMKCERYGKGCSQESDSHLCRLLCYEDCEPCHVPVKKRRTFCPHMFEVPCHLNIDKIHCKKPCTKILPCGHECIDRCGDRCGHCTMMVDKTLPICGHSLKVKCSEKPNQKMCTRECPLKLPCGHPCTTKCNEPCTKECQVKIDVALKSPCGHTITKILCCIATTADSQTPENLLKHCTEPCRVQLKCGHHCSGTCGKCYQGRLHQKCKEKCSCLLLCNHPCELLCWQQCKPCTQPCPYKCKHGNVIVSYKKKCGDICPPCKERCPRDCRHQRCTNICGEICNVPPCQEPCEKMLQCKHKCIGFCGDPCPPKCLVCDREELTKLVSGFETEEAVRFVLLEDCGHIFESRDLEQMMHQDDGIIKFKECPQCKTPIKTTQRFSDMIKKTMADVAKIKKECYGTPGKDYFSARRSDLQETMDTFNLQQKVDKIKLKYNHRLLNYCSSVGEVLQNIDKRLKPDRYGRRQVINTLESLFVESKLQILEHVISICTNITERSKKTILEQIKFIVDTLERNENFMADQEIEDLQFEINRLCRIVEYNEIKEFPKFSNLDIKNLVTDLESRLFSFGKFLDEDEQKVTESLTKLEELVQSGITISEQTKREIVKVMSFKLGCWYKCPNEHLNATEECNKPCTKTLLCGHKCQNKCNEPCGNCTTVVDKTFPVCGHSVIAECSKEPDRKMCTRECPLKLACGHPCTKKCNEPCTQYCRVTVDVALESPCGHTITEIWCCIATTAERQTPKILLKNCNEPCRVQLKCGHYCSGTCSKCYQGRIHQKCKGKCNSLLLCNHPCELLCYQACKPCTQLCPYECKHRITFFFRERCGDNRNCKQKCLRACRHQKCTNLCNEICNVPPCQEPCEKFLQCRHKCIGFCGDPCPPKCLVCDREELTKLISGFEKQEDARFVLLEDCGHIFESGSLEQIMQQDVGIIKFKECPRCKTPIKKTQRYSDMIKETMADVAVIKKNCYGTPVQDADVLKLSDQIRLDLKDNEGLKAYCASIDMVLDNIDKQSDKYRQTQIFTTELSLIWSKLLILVDLIKVCTNITESFEKTNTNPIRLIIDTLKHNKGFITDDEIDNLQLELNRLSRIVDYDLIKGHPNFLIQMESNTAVKDLATDIDNLLFGFRKFLDEDEQKVVESLTKLDELVGSGVTISEHERREIFKAVSFKQGCWHKCSNKHLYNTRKCHGAMEETKCPECVAKVEET